MVLYDSFISSLLELTSDRKALSKAESRLEHGSKNDILFARDTAFELGGGQLPCVSTLAVSSDMSFTNRVYLVGRDIDEIKKDVPFGKIVLAEIEDIDDDDEAFRRIKELEQIKYKMFVRGFMSRASAFSMREQIRVSRDAVKRGYTLADYGNSIIEEYKRMPIVKSVDVIFLTQPDSLSEIAAIAEKIKDTTSALNHILDNILFDCSSCSLKPICDEVDGMKELHQRQQKR